MAWFIHSEIIRRDIFYLSNNHFIIIYFQSVYRQLIKKVGSLILKNCQKEYEKPVEL